MPPAARQVRRLDDRLVSQIAAGEVVERPASVVKELVENALDAGAREITVALDLGGCARIAVVDDGAGMSREDAELAVERHATSKIATFDDLLDVTTLGFRGEALAAIAAVSRFELRTATRSGDGWRVAVDGGYRVASEPVPLPVGTRIEVADLFWNVPARRAFLKTPQAELRRSIEVVQGYALARCDVRFVLEHGGRRLLDTEAAPGEPRRRIGDLFGTSSAQELVEIPDWGEGGETIAGFIGRPDTPGARRAFLYVNGRMLRDRSLVGLFAKLAREEWHEDRVPPLYLFVDVPPRSVDVNVHPQKSEVRFRDRATLDRIRRAMRAALRSARGAVDAPLANVASTLPPPLAWEGFGATGFAAGSARPGGFAGDEVREPVASHDESGASPRLPSPSPAPTAQYRLAEPSFERRPVPLSGHVAADRGLVFLGQYKASLLLLESPDALLLVDQHAAHERILYERLHDVLVGSHVPTQRLLVPTQLELGLAERERLAGLVEPLVELGFEVVPLSAGALAVAAVPTVLTIAEGVALLGELASGTAPGDLRDRILAAVAAERACRGAVRIHRPLSGEHAQELISALFRCRDPWACPHGRPTVLRLGDADLERRFGRR